MQGNGLGAGYGAETRSRRLRAFPAGGSAGPRRKARAAQAPAFPRKRPQVRGVSFVRSSRCARISLGSCIIYRRYIEKLATLAREVLASFFARFPWVYPREARLSLQPLGYRVSGASRA